MALKVWVAKWWAGMYGGATWKHHIGWSNAPTVACLSLGKLTMEWKKRIGRYGVKSAKTYKNRRGQKAFSGTKQLRSTGILGLYVQQVFVSMFGDLIPIGFQPTCVALLPLFTLPRTYPPYFGLKMVKLHSRFLRKRMILAGDPLETIDPDLGINLFASLSWENADMWPDASMEQIIRYLRGSTDLNLGAWRSLFPTSI